MPRVATDRHAAVVAQALICQSRLNRQLFLFYPPHSCGQRGSSWLRLHGRSTHGSSLSPPRERLAPPRPCRHGGESTGGLAALFHGRGAWLCLAATLATHLPGNWEKKTERYAGVRRRQRGPMRSSVQALCSYELCVRPSCILFGQRVKGIRLHVGPVASYRMYYAEVSRRAISLGQLPLRCL